MYKITLIFVSIYMAGAAGTVEVQELSLTTAEKC
jgi:hypothetical protein